MRALLVILVIFAGTACRRGSGFQGNNQKASPSSTNSGGTTPPSQQVNPLFGLWKSGCYPSMTFTEDDGSEKVTAGQSIQLSVTDGLFEVTDGLYVGQPPTCSEAELHTQIKTYYAIDRFEAQQQNGIQNLVLKYTKHETINPEGILSPAHQEILGPSVGPQAIEPIKLAAGETVLAAVVLNGTKLKFGADWKRSNQYPNPNETKGEFEKIK